MKAQEDAWRVTIILNTSLNEHQAEAVGYHAASFVAVERCIPGQGWTDITMNVNAADQPEAAGKGYRAMATAIEAAGIETSPIAVTAQDTDAWAQAVTRPRTDLVGAVEAAEILGVSRTRVHQLAAQPQFPGSASLHGLHEVSITGVS